MKHAIEIDPEMLPLMRAALEDERAKTENHIAGLEDKLTRIDAQIAKIDAKLEATEPSVREPGTRMKKGLGEKLIREFLQSQNGSGATIRAVTEATNTSYASAYRILNALVKDNFATEQNNVFHWKQENALDATALWVRDNLSEEIEEERPMRAPA